MESFIFSFAEPNEPQKRPQIIRLAKNCSEIEQFTSNSL